MEGLHPIDKTRYATAGATLYVCYTSLRQIDAGPWLTIPAVPLVTFVLFYLIGFFREDRTPSVVRSETLHQEAKRGKGG